MFVKYKFTIETFLLKIHLKVLLKYYFVINVKPKRCRRNIFDEPHTGRPKNTAEKFDKFPTIFQSLGIVKKR